MDLWLSHDSAVQCCTFVSFFGDVFREDRMVLAATLHECPVPHRWHLGWLVEVGTLPLEAERSDRMQGGLALCPCVPAALFALWVEHGGCLQHPWEQSSYPSLLFLHTFAAKSSHQLSTLSALPHPCAPEPEEWGTGAAVLQGTGGTSGTPALTPLGWAAAPGFG